MHGRRRCCVLDKSNEIRIYKVVVDVLMHARAFKGNFKKNLHGGENQ